MTAPFKIILTIACLSASSNAFSQDLGNIGKQFKDEKAVQLSGSVFTNSNFLASNQIDQDLWNYNFGGNLNFKLYGVSVPVKFVIRNTNVSLSNSINFNRFGLSPRYKSVTLHGGYRSMNFHPYIYNGQTFLGGGVEFKNAKFTFQGIQGQLQNFITTRASDEFDERSLETYDRSVSGLRAGFTSNAIEFYISGMRFIDDPLSVELTDSLRNIYRPQENLALGIETKMRFGTYVELNVNTAYSAFTNDSRASTAGIDTAFISAVQPLINVNGSSRAALAGEAELSFNLQSITVGGSYKRVEPDYQSLGLYQINNDFVDKTGFVNLRLLRGKFVTSFRYGIRHNNVTDARTTKDNRNLLSASVNVKPVDFFNLQLRYSDHSSEREGALVELNDTLYYAQASQTLGVNPSFIFKPNEIKHTIGFDYLDQDVETITDSQADFGTEIQSITARYKVGFSKDLNISLAARQNELISSRGINSRQTLRLTVQKKLWEKKLNCRLAVMGGDKKTDQVSIGQMYEFRGTLGLRIAKVHNLNLTLRYLNQPISSEKIRKEQRINLSYAYSFKT